ncbi:dual 3',5'-cyclic-AMP and -GMP phosphodiesterase 11 [Caerostris extrusa]|uniref:Dual 3',5'-cyclic-AMP and -GMP phosphodiesterase 11 n=1 Tax=Caerostris extrusa TaxID=172846 RepID=A0AAV4NDT9_CAEEX|nr:dual 3',5'-cyclic-AMP and -GMP phosphodiesterase 11 [Caerostris extrusa]
MRLMAFVLCRWLPSVKRNYRPVAYHNWRHAFNVPQMMFAILTGNQILSHLTPEEYIKVIPVLKDAILATDLDLHYKAMLMTACDIAAITKPWKIQKKKDMMNRDKKAMLPLMQVAFIDSICLPLYEAFAMISDKLCPLLAGVKENRAQWLKLAEGKELCFSSENKNILKLLFEIQVTEDFGNNLKLCADKKPFLHERHLRRNNASRKGCDPLLVWGSSNRPQRTFSPAMHLFAFFISLLTELELTKELKDGASVGRKEYRIVKF